MPADFTPFLSGVTVEPPAPTWDKKGTYTYHTDALNQLVAEVLKTQFPDIVGAITAKVTKNQPKPGALMEYAPLADTINAPMRSEYGSNLTAMRDLKGNVLGVKGFDSDAVVENLAPLLHEFYHARAIKGAGKYSEGAAMGGKEWQVMLENAITAGFPSISDTYGGGDKMEEFLASATTIKRLQAAKIPVKGRLAQAAENLPQLEALHPWLSDYINAWQAPELRKKESSK